MSLPQSQSNSGAALRDAGVAAVTAAAVDDGHAQFLAVAEAKFLDHLARNPGGATMDEALANVPRPEGFRAKALGGIPARLARRGRIVRIGAKASAVPSRHAGLASVWRLA